jgi:hypothetical protein
MKTLAVSALVVTCTWIGVPAQQVVDPLESIHDLRVNGPAGTVLQASGSLTGAGDVRLFDSTGAVLAVASLPMQHPMWIERTAVSPCRYLMGGTGFDATSGSRVGWMARVEVPDAADAVAVTSTVVLADVWPVAAVIADRALVFVDGKTRRILAAAVGHTTFPDLTQADVVATAAMLPSLSRPGGLAASRLQVSVSGAMPLTLSAKVAAGRAGARAIDAAYVYA